MAGGAGAIGPRRHRHALGRADQRRRWECQPWRDSCARPGAGEIRTCGLPAPGREAFERMHRVVERLQELKQ